MKYKKAKYRIEDSIFPYILAGLLETQIKQAPEFSKSYEKALEELYEAYKNDLNTPELLRRAERIREKVFAHWQKNKTIIRKAIMELSHLYNVIKDKEEFNNISSIDNLFDEIDFCIGEGCLDKNIQKQDSSAAKQAPKVFRALQDEGLF